LRAGWSAAHLQISIGISLRENECPKAGIAKPAPPGPLCMTQRQCQPQTELQSLPHPVVSQCCAEHGKPEEGAVTC